jgi:predicted ArsR family transcriptional regulator
MTTDCYIGDELETLIDTLDKLGPCSATALARALDVRPVAIRSTLAHLEATGMVVRQGTARSTTWDLG